MRQHPLVGIAVSYWGEPAEVTRVLGDWRVYDGRSGHVVGLYLPAREEFARAHVCTSGGRPTVVELPELDVIVFDARPYRWATGGAA